MSHECPDCGMVCYCGGDIGDCCFDDEYYVIRCSHCPAGIEDDTDDDWMEE